MTDSDSDMTLDEYAESYYTSKAIEKGSNVEVTWKVYYFSVGVDESVLYIDVKRDGDLAVLILKEEQIAELCKEYPEFLKIVSNNSQNENQLLPLLDIQKEGENVLIPGIKEPVEFVEPDIAMAEKTTELSSELPLIEARLKRELWKQRYKKRLDRTSKSSGIPIELEVEINKDGSLVVTPIDPDFNSVSWEYSEPNRLDTATQKLIDEAGGDPRYIDGMRAFLLPRKECESLETVRVNKLGFALVPESTYRNWHPEKTTITENFINFFVSD